MVKRGNEVPYRAASILPPSFDFPYCGQSPDTYIPLNKADHWHARGAGGLGAIVRLKPAISSQQFQTGLDAHSAALASQFPATNRGSSLHIKQLNRFPPWRPPSSIALAHDSSAGSATSSHGQRQRHLACPMDPSTAAGCNSTQKRQLNTSESGYRKPNGSR